jgi:beta-phosphoglucomutase-like phosphatase (HAD superfamily)
MDGTLINSSPAVVKAWTLFSETYPLDLDDILKCRSILVACVNSKLTILAAHGMRTIDVLKKWCGITDGPTLEKEVIRFETAILEAAEALGRETGESGIQVLPGVAKLLADLGSEADKRDGEEKWAICTSCESSKHWTEIWH